MGNDKNGNKDTESELLRKLHDLNARIDAAPEGNPLANKAKKVKIKLDQMAEEKTRGCIVRSRARWYQSGEKCNKYLLNLSKRSYTKRHKKLKSSAGSTIEDLKTILNEGKNYYQQLYTSQGQISLDQLSDFLNSGPLPRLDDVSQSLCEGSISEAECLSAIKFFSVTRPRNKRYNSGVLSLFLEGDFLPFD